MNGARGGYISFVAAITVAVLALAVLMFARAQSSLGPALRRLDTQIRLETAAQTAEARVAYLLATEPLSGAAIVVGGERGLAPAEQVAPSQRRSASGASIEQVALDGRPYSLGDASVSIQDESGLLNLNTLDERAVAALLARSGADIGVEASLAATLADYIDEDGLRRPGGAERGDYRVGAPLNLAIRSPRSALNALGWRETLGAQARETLFSLASSRSDSGLNVNTAPAVVLEAALGASPSQARAIEMQRHTQLFRASEEIEAVLGIATNADGAQPIVASTGRIRLMVRLGNTNEASQWAYESTLVLAAGEAEQPVYWLKGAVRRLHGGTALGTYGVEPLPTGAGVSS